MNRAPRAGRSDAAWCAEFFRNALPAVACIALAGIFWQAQAHSQGQEERPGAPKVEFGRVAYDDINMERLRLAVELRLVSPRGNVLLQGLSFEHMTINGLPIVVQPYEGEVKLEKDQPVALAKPLLLELYYREINSFESVRELLRTSQVQLQGRIHARARLTGAAGFITFGHTFRNDFPVTEQVKVEALEHPLVRPVVDRALTELADPQSRLNVRWLEEKLQLQALYRAGSNVAPGVVLIETHYRLVDRKTSEARDLVQFGAASLVAPQRFLTTKQVVEPWKFDIEAARLLADGARLDSKGYEIIVWPAGSRAAESQNGPAWRLSKKEVSLERGVDDDLVDASVDAGAGERRLRVHRLESAKNVATLRVRSNLAAGQPLLVEAIGETAGKSARESAGEQKDALLGIRYVPPVEPVEASRALSAWVTVRWEENAVRFDRRFPDYAVGAPLFDVRGRVRAIYLGANSALPIGSALAAAK
jgi:hypothetical protein